MGASWMEAVMANAAMSEQIMVVRIVSPRRSGVVCYDADLTDSLRVGESYGWLGGYWST